MNSAEMKAAIQADIETLKTMDVDILSEKEYYGRIRKRYCLVWMTMYAALILPFLLSYSLNINGIRYPGSEAFEDAILAWLAGIPITFIFTIPLVGLINNYVIFQAQFKDKLQLGEIIDDFIRRVTRLACISYWGVILLTAAAFHPSTLLFFGAFGGGIIMFGIGGFINMEIKRLGISVLFEALKKHFEKDEAALAP